MPKSLGQNLKIARQAAGFTTQSAFADATGFSQAQISGWERARRNPDLPTVMHLAKTLHVSVDALLVGVDKQYDVWRDPRADLIAAQAELANRFEALQQTIVQTYDALDKIQASLAASQKRAADFQRHRHVYIVPKRRWGGGEQMTKTKAPTTKKPQTPGDPDARHK